MGAATTGEPVLQLEKPVHHNTEPASSRARAPLQERPTQHKEDPVQPKIKKKRERKKNFQSHLSDKGLVF